MFKNLNNLNNLIGLPEETVLDVVKITVIGKSSIHLENYGRLLVYTEDEIMVKTSDGVLKIVGNGLKIEAIDKNFIEIKGCFLCISYEN